MGKEKRSLTYKKASFSGKHNIVKLRVFIFLSTYSNYQFNYQHIAFYAGVNANYISGRLRLWCQWGYLSRIKRGGQFYYQPWSRCKHFIDIAPPDLVQSIVEEQRQRVAAYPF